jgi:hypothetical protein
VSGQITLTLICDFYGSLSDFCSNCLGSGTVLTINGGGFTWTDFRFYHADHGTGGTLSVSNIVLFTSSIDDYAIYSIDTKTYLADVTIDGYSGRSEETGGGAMRIRSADYCGDTVPSITRVTAQNNCRGFRIQDSNCVSVEDSIAINNTDNSFYFASGTYTSASGCTNSIFKNCSATNSGNTAFMFIGGSNLTVEDCSINATRGAGMMVYNINADAYVKSTTFDSANTAETVTPHGGNTDDVNGASIGVRVTNADTNATVKVTSCTFNGGGETNSKVFDEDCPANLTFVSGNTYNSSNYASPAWTSDTCTSGVSPPTGLYDPSTTSTTTTSTTTTTTTNNCEGPFAVSGYFPLYATAACANAASSLGTSHTHTLPPNCNDNTNTATTTTTEEATSTEESTTTTSSSESTVVVFAHDESVCTTYYMPNGLNMDPNNGEITQWHGNYTENTASTTTTTTTTTKTSRSTPLQLPVNVTYNITLDNLDDQQSRDDAEAVARSWAAALIPNATVTVTFVQVPVSQSALSTDVLQSNHACPSAGRKRRDVGEDDTPSNSYDDLTPSQLWSMVFIMAYRSFMETVSAIQEAGVFLDAVGENTLSCALTTQHFEVRNTTTVWNRAVDTAEGLTVFADQAIPLEYLQVERQKGMVLSTELLDLDEGLCVLQENNCIFDTGGPSIAYANEEYCQFSVKKRSVMRFIQLDIEHPHDEIRVYSSQETTVGFVSLGIFPDDMVVDAGSRIQWWSDDSITYDGFEICFAAVEDDDDGLSTGAYVGIAVGGVAALGIAGYFVYTKLIATGGKHAQSHVPF